MRLVPLAGLAALVALSCPALAGMEAVQPDARDHYAETMDRLISRDEGVAPEPASDADVLQDCRLVTPASAA